MGETLSHVQLNDRWRIRRGGKLIYAETMRFGPLVGGILDHSVTFGDAKAFASLVYVAPDALNRLARVRQLLAKASIEVAASAWNDMLVVRFLAQEGQALRETLIEFLRAFRDQDLPRVWHL